MYMKVVSSTGMLWYSMKLYKLVYIRFILEMFKECLVVIVVIIAIAIIATWLGGNYLTSSCTTVVV